MPKVHLAITLGDPAGIGPEVVLKALADPSVTEDCLLTVIGSRALLSQTYQQLSPISGKQALADPNTLSIVDVPLSATEPLKPGQGNAASGAASFAYLDEAISRTLSGEFQGIVTAPIAKFCWKAARNLYPGQTEVLAQRAGVTKFGMLFVARSPYTGWTLRTLLATTHIPLQQVPTALTPELMSLKLALLIECLEKDFGIAAPRIIIAGLNPHSGEGGQLGQEEQDWLIPWLNEERQNRPQVKLIGPVPPDTMWVQTGRAWCGQADEYRLQWSSSRNAADAYLALYHDQGLIPVKLLAFDRAINTTIGLPFVRTSPDHGTAFDIAGQGVANATSTKEAIRLAIQLVKQRLLVPSFPG